MAKESMLTEKEAVPRFGPVGWKRGVVLSPPESSEGLVCLFDFVVKIRESC